MSLKLRRGTDLERQSFIPDVGELIYTTDLKQLWAGDGTTQGGNRVSYAGSVGGAMGSDLLLSTHSITGTGNIDITGTITSTGNIVSGGNITAAGNIFANGDIQLGNSNTDNISFGADVNSNIIPNTTEVFDLGSSSQRWSTVYANNVFADLEGNVRASDSTILVDAVNGVLKGTLQGNLVGPVQGAVTGNVTGGLTGAVKASNGVTVLDNGTDGTNAVFNGTVNGTFNGEVLNGVLTTGVYADPAWISSLNANRIFGTLRNTFVEGDVKGSVFGDDSSILVDGAHGVLRGIHIGSLQGTVDTGSLTIVNNTISTVNTGDNLVLTTIGTGYVSVPGTLNAGKINVDTDAAGGVAIRAQSNTAQQFTLSGAYDSAASSASNGYSVNFSRSRGTLLAQTPLQAGDEISTTVYTGLTGIAGYRAAAGIIATTGTTVSSGVMTGELALAVNDGNQATPVARLTIKQDGVVRFDSPTLTAGEVNTSSVATYLKVMIGGTAYAIPAYALV